MALTCSQGGRKEWPVAKGISTAPKMATKAPVAGALMAVAEGETNVVRLMLES